MSVTSYSTVSRRSSGRVLASALVPFVSRGKKYQSGTSLSMRHTEHFIAFPSLVNSVWGFT